MSLLVIVIIAFMFLEFANVLALYFKKDSKMFNSVGVFNAWEKSKQDPEMHNFTSYLVNWVAGTKLIFLSILIVILIFASEQTQVWVLLALIISIMSFYWKLYPLVKKMDRESQLTPSKYSRTLGVMISVFIIVFLIVFIYTFIQLY
ncbi:MAG: hypothetical protein ACW98U_04095 [Candidatus Thorarchaeota archaeon]|jgi:hypothetical protein